MRGDHLIGVAFLGEAACFLIACGSNPNGQQASGSGNNVVTFQMTDSCNDGNTVYYRYFDSTDNLLWPNSSEFYEVGPGNSYTSNLQCKTGAKICFGATENTIRTAPIGALASTTHNPVPIAA